MPLMAHQTILPQSKEARMFDFITVGRGDE
jgi:hypothetical protein